MMATAIIQVGVDGSKTRVVVVKLGKRFDSGFFKAHKQNLLLVWI